MSAEEVIGLEEDQGAHDGERERSTIAFPYADVDNAVRIAKGVHQFGTSCELGQLAAQLDVAVNGGGFRQMLSAAKVFGLVTFAKKSVQLTVLGQRVNDPKQEKSAKAQAFLTVPLYRAIYDRVKGAGGTLPPAAGLENEMVSLGVAKKVVDRARQAFQRSALQAGFFAFGQERLVLPAGAGHDGRDVSEHRDDAPKKPPKNEDGGGGNGRDPLLQGLINKLPTEGSSWPAAERVAWLELAKGIFDFVYGRDEAIEVGLAKKSA